jgi:hypothetical protein
MSILLHGLRSAGVSLYIAVVGNNQLVSFSKFLLNLVQYFHLSCLFFCATLLCLSPFQLQVSLSVNQWILQTRSRITARNIHPRFGNPFLIFWNPLDPTPNNWRCLLSACASTYFLPRSFAYWLLACLQAFLSSIPASVVASSSFSYYS